MGVPPPAPKFEWFNNMVKFKFGYSFLQVLYRFIVSGLLDAADQAFKVMKSPKDIFFLDLDNNGKWKVVNEDQLKKL